MWTKRTSINSENWGYDQENYDIEKGEDRDRVGNYRKFISQQIILNRKQMQNELDSNNLLYHAPK